MNIGGKIRLLLLLLGICCIATALSLNNAVTKRDLLIHEAKTLQDNLALKEQTVANFLQSPDYLNQLKSLCKDYKLATNFINTYPQQGINLLVYQNENPIFWSSSSTFPEIRALPEGSSFRRLSNGWYEVIKKRDKAYTYVFLIDVKAQFSIQNQYLKNQFFSSLFPSKTLDLATFTDKDFVDIFNIHKEFLFAVKLSSEISKKTYANLQIWLWLTGLFSICLFVNSYCSSLAKKGFVGWATAILALFFLALRFSDLQYFWFNHQFNLEIFNPSIYAESDFLPSLGDLFLNVLAISWVAIFAYTHRYQYRLPRWLSENKATGILLHVFLLSIVLVVAILLDAVFFGLIYNSKINFNITNIISLSWVSWISIFVLCLAWFNVYVLINIFVELSKQLQSSNKQRLIIFCTVLFGIFIYKLATDFNVFFLVYELLIFLIGWNNYIQHRKFSVISFALLFLCMAFLTSLKYLRFNGIKERSNRAIIAEKILNAEDPKVINSIISFEAGITSDSTVLTYFKQLEHKQPFGFLNYLEKKYLDGYLSRYEYKIYAFNTNDEGLNSTQKTSISKYRELVKSGALKTPETNFSYRINDTFGFLNYFSIIPIFEKNTLLGSLVIELKSQPYDYNSRFPDVLIDGKLKSDEDFTNYSLAFYKDNRLFNQSGKYTYPMLNNAFKADIGAVNFVNDTTNFSHAIYQPNKSKLIVISTERVPYLERLATLSFFFLVFIIFGAALHLFIWLVKRIDEHHTDWFKFNRLFMINANKVLYKTRIQFSVVFSVVATLLIVGWTTFFFIKNEYLRQQEESMKEKLRKVQLSFEKQIANMDVLINDDQTKFEFNQFADLNTAVLNLYDLDGNLYLTSLPKMYDGGIVSKKINPHAFVHLNLIKQSEYLNKAERIGSFKYAAAYAPIRNMQNKTIAYIGIPFYATVSDYESKIGLFINTLINIYALVFVLIGILAVFLANQITSPLTFIQESISKTKLGQKNQPIIWHRQDEIGSLIKEYNKMIAALELSASKLARSERESAWREMAKQVAHEIKNPLTPLKLGVQLLEKSWRENDPNFERKFASFNKSFIEQIDSLATIASEFSSFAKMPDTKLEELELMPIIKQTLTVFDTSDFTEIMVLDRTNKKITIMGDRDQLMRSFNNLLKNAIEASEGKEKCAIQIRIINDDKNVYVEVKDNGKGIDMALEDKIFVPNFTTKSSGTGLGLAFVKQAIENAGGNIEFKSEVNLGTTFYLTFPLV